MCSHETPNRFSALLLPSVCSPSTTYIRLDSTSAQLTSSLPLCPAPLAAQSYECVPVSRTGPKPSHLFWLCHPLLLCSRAGWDTLGILPSGRIPLGIDRVAFGR